LLTKFHYLNTVISNLINEIVADLYKKAGEGIVCYKRIADILTYVIKRKPIYFPRDLEKDVMWISTVDKVRRLFNFINIIQEKYVASMLDHYKSALDHAKGIISLSKTRYIILCDAFSLTEALYFAVIFRRKIRFITALINPGGNTLTFKYLMSASSGMPFEEATHSKIAKYLKEFFGAKDHNVFREIDQAVHRLQDVNKNYVASELYSITTRLSNGIRNVMESYKASLILLSDHGYDIDCIGSVCSLKHCWENKASLSTLAPLLIIG